MKSAKVQSLFMQVFAAIISLAAGATAEDSDELTSSNIEDADPSGSAGKQAPLPSAPKVGSLESGAPTEGPPGMGPMPSLRLGVLTRVDVGLAGTEFDDPYSTALMGIGINGNVYESLSHTASIATSYDPRDPSGAVSLLDVIIQFEPVEVLNVWFGRMIVPVDRSSLAGPWFIAPWIYAGIGHVDGQVHLPRAAFLGRGDGATVWGSVFGGHLKYYASAVDLVIPGESPLLSGRVSLALFNPEPGFYSPSTYFGNDVLAIGVGGQSKKDGSVNPMIQRKSDYREYNADLLFEKDLGPGGVLDLEAAYYQFKGDNERTSSSYFGLVSYVLPGQIAGARLQPLGRIQQAIPAAPGAPTSTVVDAQLGIILRGHIARLALGYRRAHAGALETSSIFLGLQLLRL